MGIASYVYDAGAGDVRIEPQSLESEGFFGLLRSGYPCQVTVDTIVGQMQARRMDYVFPGLDGGASLTFGLAAVPMTWKVTAIAYINDIQNFEKACREAIKGAARGTLAEEIGDGLITGTWPETEIRSLRRSAALQAVGGPTGSPAIQLYFVEWTIEFMWQRPTS